MKAHQFLVKVVLSAITRLISSSSVCALSTILFTFRCQQSDPSSTVSPNAGILLFGKWPMPCFSQRASRTYFGLLPLLMPTYCETDYLQAASVRTRHMNYFSINARVSTNFVYLAAIATNSCRPTPKFLDSQREGV